MSSIKRSATQISPREDRSTVHELTTHMHSVPDTDAAERIKVELILSLRHVCLMARALRLSSSSECVCVDTWVHIQLNDRSRTIDPIHTNDGNDF